MLMNLFWILIRYKKKWSYGLTLEDTQKNQEQNEESLKDLASLANQYTKLIQDEKVKSKLELIVANVGKIDPKRHLSNVFYWLYRESKA